MFKPWNIFIFDWTNVRQKPNCTADSVVSHLNDTTPNGRYHIALDKQENIQLNHIFCRCKKERKTPKLIFLRSTDEKEVREFPTPECEFKSLGPTLCLTNQTFYFSVNVDLEVEFDNETVMIQCLINGEADQKYGWEYGDVQELTLLDLPILLQTPWCVHQINPWKTRRNLSSCL